MKGWRYEVDHPDYWPVEVTAQEPGEAVKAACEIWRSTIAWVYLAAYCTVKRLGTARKPRCRRCRALYGKAGEPDGLCLACERAEQLYKMQYQKMFYGYESRRKRERMGG